MLFGLGWTYQSPILFLLVDPSGCFSTELAATIGSLQAALAAQKLAPAQSQQLLLLQRQAAASSEANPSLTVESKSTLGQQSMGPAATSQELSVAQMMMTLAQASGRNPTSLDSKNTTAQKLPDFAKNNPQSNNTCCIHFHYDINYTSCFNMGDT